MIVQGTDGGLLLFRQTDHALLSGAFAEAWALAPLQRRASVLVAASRHDDGWADWELAPTLNDTGRPVDFIGVPVREHVALYRRGIDLVEDEDPYAGYAVSLHGERLYTRPFHPGMQPRIDHLSGDALEDARAYVAHEQARQLRLSEAHGLDHAELDEVWRFLQVWDRLSLFVCMAPIGTGGTATMPPVRDASGSEVTITITSHEPGLVRLDPYPFGEMERGFAIAASFLPGDRFDDEVAFRRAYRSAQTRIISFTACPALTR